VLSYVVLALNLAVYAVGIGIALTAGGEASNDYFLQLAKVNEDVLNGQYWRCAASGDCALQRAVCVLPSQLPVLGGPSAARVSVQSMLLGP